VPEYWEVFGRPVTSVGRNPLVLSGVVLAGANQHWSENNVGADSILTAEEVAGLDLRDTDLVVLSACETALGRVAGGEGVFGLQRAFALSGARTVLASLWQVDDRSTEVLMTEFYWNLWHKNLGKLEALREAQLTMLRYDPEKQAIRPRGVYSPDGAEAPGLGDPYYWAAFTLSGDWR
jgi:CHAT domain-containing protein